MLDVFLVRALVSNEHDVREEEGNHVLVYLLPLQGRQNTVQINALNQQEVSKTWEKSER